MTSLSSDGGGTTPSGMLSSSLPRSGSGSLLAVGSGNGSGISGIEKKTGTPSLNRSPSSDQYSTSTYEANRFPAHLSYSSPEHSTSRSRDIPSSSTAPTAAAATGIFGTPPSNGNHHWTLSSPSPPSKSYSSSTAVAAHHHYQQFANLDLRGEEDPNITRAREIEKLRRKRSLRVLYLLEFISSAGFSVALPSLWPYVSHLGGTTAMLGYALLHQFWMHQC
jgi:hypothetical protein